MCNLHSGVTLFAPVLHFWHWCYTWTTLFSANQSRVSFTVIPFGKPWCFGGKCPIMMRWKKIKQKQHPHPFNMSNWTTTLKLYSLQSSGWGNGVHFLHLVLFFAGVINLTGREKSVYKVFQFTIWILLKLQTVVLWRI